MIRQMPAFETKNFLFYSKESKTYKIKNQSANKTQAYRVQKVKGSGNFLEG